MPKFTRKSSQSKHPDSSDESGIATANLLQNSIRRLSNNYRTVAVEQFLRLAEEVEENPNLTYTEQLAVLLEAVHSISAVVGRLSRSFPEKAPELWEFREDKSENSYDFTRRVYHDYLERGLSRPDILSLDPKLYQAIHDRRRRYKDNSLNLRTKRQVNDALLTNVNPNFSLAEFTKNIPEIFRRPLGLYSTVTTRRHRSKLAKPK